MARPASDIAERVVHAARERFLEEGVDGASLRAIARDAGTNVGMVYYYYPSKDELFLAVVEEVYAKLLDDAVHAMVDPALDTEAKIARLYARLGALSDVELKVVRLVLREGMASSSRLGRLFERFTRGHVPMLLAMLHNGVTRGEVRSDLPPLVLVLSTLVLGLLPQILRRRLGESAVPVDALFPPAAELAQILCRVLLEGIGSAPENAQAGKPEHRPTG